MMVMMVMVVIVVVVVVLDCRVQDRPAEHADDVQEVERQ